jgi:hypothetical protein
MTFERWVETGKRLCRVGARVNWWIGDWWIAGHAYGERAKLAAEGGVFELEFSTLAILGHVARRFETLRRRKVLTWAHHREVAATGGRLPVGETRTR